MRDMAPPQQQAMPAQGVPVQHYPPQQQGSGYYPPQPTYNEPNAPPKASDAASGEYALVGYVADTRVCGVQAYV